MRKRASFSLYWSFVLEFDPKMLAELLKKALRSRENKSEEKCHLVRIEIPDEMCAVIQSFFRDPYFRWHDGAKNETFTGFGEVERFENSANRIHSLRLKVQIWKNRLITDPELRDLPLAFGGFSFDPLRAENLRLKASQNSSNERWKAWKDAFFVIPSLLIWTKYNSKKHRSTRMFFTISIKQNNNSLRQLGKQVKDLFFRLKPSQIPSNQKSFSPNFEKNKAQKTSFRADYISRVSAAIKHIKQNHNEKIVLTREAVFRFSEELKTDPLETFEALQTQNLEGFSFLFSGPNQSYFIGAPPELLARLDRETLSTHALAGTAKRGENAAQDAQIGQELLQDPKEKNEHDIVVQAILNSLKTLRPKQCYLEAQTLLKLSHVQHIMTNIRAQVSAEIDIFHALEVLHPTPAVGGSPQKEALQWLREHEGYDRGWYCGPVGWINAEGDGVFCVALRSALLSKREIVAFVGAGIVASSQPEKEWIETELKLNTIKNAIRVTRKT